MLVPIRRHGAFLIASTDDEAAAGQALVRWADSVLPREMNTGAADAALAGRPADDARAPSRPPARTRRTATHGYALANRAFSSLYTAMRARDAAEILETALLSGDGPPEIGAQVARRAGIAASESRGTYEGLWLLERADEHARESAEPRPRGGTDGEHPRRDAPRRGRPRPGRGRGPARDRARPRHRPDRSAGDPHPRRTRSSSGATWPRASELAQSLLTTRQEDEPWLTLSARTAAGPDRPGAGPPARGRHRRAARVRRGA